MPDANKPLVSALMPTNAATVLAKTDRLVVRQQKEWAEIFTGWETKNRYVVQTEDGRGLFVAGEVGGSWLARILLKAKRPFTIEVRHSSGGEAIRVRRPWRWFFSMAEVFDHQGNLLGTIQQRFTLLRRRYTVLDSSGAEIFELHGPIFRPWTFKIMEGTVQKGMIQKKWSGLLKETFSDADNFVVEFDASLAPEHRAIFLGATFLIDFVHFENKG